MGRIKGWKKGLQIGVTETYANTNYKEFGLFIDQLQWGEWGVGIRDRMSGFKKTLGTFPTQAKAQKYALSWMKKHPKG